MLGGIVGITAGLGASAIVCRGLKMPFILGLPIVFIAFIFSAAVGEVFDFFPARKAARLDPIDALRYE